MKRLLIFDCKVYGCSNPSPSVLGVALKSRNLLILGFRLLLVLPFKYSLKIISFRILLAIIISVSINIKITYSGDPENWKMATNNQNKPSALPIIALRDHDYIIDDVSFENTSLKTCNQSTPFATDQNQILTSSIRQCDGNQSDVIPSVPKSGSTSSCTNPNSTGLSSFFKHSPPGSFSICVPVNQSEIKFLANSEISLCLLNQTGESSSLLTPGWKDGQSKCAKKVKSLIEDFDKHIKNPKYHFSVMEKYILEIFKIAGVSTTKDPLNPYKILIEPCILSLRAITKIYKAGNDFSLPASKYYFMFLLDRFRFIRNEVKKMQSSQAHHNY